MQWYYSSVARSFCTEKVHPPSPQVRGRTCEEDQDRIDHGEFPCIQGSNGCIKKVDKLAPIRAEAYLEKARVMFEELKRWICNGIWISWRNSNCK
jgi:hypothetical protein